MGPPGDRRLRHLPRGLDRQPAGHLSHPKHAGGAAGQYAIRCQACHYGTTTDGTTIASQTLHVNTSAEVSFNTLGDPRVHVNSSYGGDTVMGSGYGTCTATYCHSRGNDTVAPYNDVPLSVPVAPLPAWGGRHLSCSSCHGNSTAVTTDTSMPDYVDGTPKANKHDIHNTTNAFVCQTCHYPTTQATGHDRRHHAARQRSYDAGLPTPPTRRSTSSPGRAGTATPSSATAATARSPGRRRVRTPATSATAPWAAP